MDFVNDHACTQEFPYCVSVLDSENNPSDNLDNFALLEDAIDYAKNNPGTAVFLEKYNSEKNICEYDLVWRPNDDPPQLVEWELTISGYNDLSQSDKDLARSIIAEAIEVFNDFEVSLVHKG